MTVFSCFCGWMIHTRKLTTLNHNAVTETEICCFFSYFNLGENMGTLMPVKKNTTHKEQPLSHIVSLFSY